MLIKHGVLHFPCKLNPHATFTGNQTYPIYHIWKKFNAKEGQIRWGYIMYWDGRTQKGSRSQPNTQYLANSKGICIHRIHIQIYIYIHTGS